MEPLRLLSFSFSILILFSSTHARLSLNHVSFPPTEAPASSPELQPVASLIVKKHDETNLPSLGYAVSPLVIDPAKKIRGSHKHHHHATKDVLALHKICSSTSYPVVCIKSLKPHLNGKTDTFSVLEIAVKASIEQTKTAMEKIAKLSKAPGTPAKIVSRLGDCNNSYKDALYNFGSAMEALPERDLGTVKTMLSASMTDFDVCDDELSELSDGSDSPASGYGKNLNQMVSNSLAIANLVQ